MKRSLWFGVGTILLFLLFSDGLILLASPQPFLYGVTNAFGTRFEETILYLPMVKNFSLATPLMIDFTGPLSTSSYGPAPYAALFFMKVISSFAGSNINLAVFFLHATVLISFLFVFFVLKLEMGNRRLLATASLLILFGQDLAFHAAKAMGQSFADPVVTRFLSPNVSFVFFFGALALLWSSEHALAQGRRVGPVRLSAVFALMALNFYVYFCNWMILVPTLFLWLFLRREALRSERKNLLIGSVLFLALGLPFAGLVLATKTQSFLIEYLQRASFLGTDAYTRFNYPPLLALIVLMFGLGILVFGFKASLSKDSSNLTLTPILTLILFGLSISMAYINYVVPNSVPVPMLFHRYWVPLGMLSLVSIGLRVLDSGTCPHWVRGFLRPRIQWALSSLVFVGILFLSLGRYNAHAKALGPAVEADAGRLQKIEKLIDTQTIFISPRHQLQLLAPGVIGARTFIISPTITPVENFKIVKYFSYMGHLLSWKKEDFLFRLGDIDQFGEVHEVNTEISTTIMFMSQRRGLPYPIPSKWLHENEAKILEFFGSVSLEMITKEFPNILFCKTSEDSENPPVPMEFSLVYEDADLKCWRSRPPGS